MSKAASNKELERTRSTQAAVGPRRSLQCWAGRAAIFAVLMLGLLPLGCGGGGGSPSAPTTIVATPTPVPTPTPLMRVEPTNRFTFGPEGTVQAGTVFRFNIVTSPGGMNLRLHRCAEPCSSAFAIKVWSPSELRQGGELSWTVDQTARYYIWGEDTAASASLRINSDEPRGLQLRVTFQGGTIVDGWYEAR